MAVSMEYLLGTAAVCLLISLLLAWIASFIYYVKVAFLKKWFPASHQLIRSHIDYLMMTGLLVVTHYMCGLYAIVLPAGIIILLCIGTLYNPFGFILLAMKPEMANPKTRADQIKIMLGFIPVTIGFGYAMVSILIAMA